MFLPSIDVSLICSLFLSFDLLKQDENIELTIAYFFNTSQYLIGVYLETSMRKVGKRNFLRAPEMIPHLKGASNLCVIQCHSIGVIEELIYA